MSDFKITGLWTGPLNADLDLQITQYADGTMTAAVMAPLTDTSWGPATELERRSIL